MQWLKRHPVPIIAVATHSLLVLAVWQAVEVSDDPEIAWLWILFEVIDWPSSTLFEWHSLIGAGTVAKTAVFGGLQWFILGMLLQLCRNAALRHVRGGASDGDLPAAPNEENRSSSGAEL